MSTPKARVIAFYLPQFHPIPENDEWWGEGFTEWTAVRRATPQFPGHVQPKVPTELGYYDLRDPAVRQAQADLARAHGIEGFCYWHYWVGNGRRLLEAPFDAVLNSGEPDFPFCLGWANHDWKGTIFGAGKRCLLKQEYPGQADFDAHFELLVKAFQDPRYIRVDGKPLFYIYLPAQIPNCKQLLTDWRQRAWDAGLNGLFVIGGLAEGYTAASLGLDGIHISRHRHIERAERQRRQRLLKRLKFLPPVHEGLQKRWSKGPRIYRYHAAIRQVLARRYRDNEYPTIVPNWDTTPRYADDATIYADARPDVFQKHVREALKKVQDRTIQQRIVFLKSWNEWAEGNYIEPDQEFGRARLECLRRELMPG